MKKWPATARVGEQGKIEFNGESYDTPSGAAKAVGSSAGGWTFWAVQIIRKVIIDDFREEFIFSNEGTKT